MPHMMLLCYGKSSHTGYEISELQRQIWLSVVGWDTNEDILLNRCTKPVRASGIIAKLQ